MTAARKISPFHIIAGILFGIMALNRLVLMVQFIMQQLTYDLMFDVPSLLMFLAVNYGLSLAAYAITAVCLLVYQFTSARPLSLVGVGALTLFQLFSFFIGFWGQKYAIYADGMFVFRPLCVLPSLVMLAGTVVLFVFAVLSLQDQARQRSVRAKVLGFVPGLCAFLYYFLTLVIAFMFMLLFRLQWYIGFPFWNVLSFAALSEIFAELLFIAAFLMAGLGFAFPGGQKQTQAPQRTGPYQAGGGPANGRYNGPGPVPGSGYVPGPGPVPGSGYVSGPGPVSGSGYVPGSGYIPGPGPVSGPGPHDPSGAGANVVEELRQYKELLDSGVITEEEFSAKKKQLLGL